MPFPRNFFERVDGSPDALFYATPRFVTHIDEGAIAAVTQLYREYFPPGATVLDLMSSWVSHLPSDAPYRRVVGVGMNADELAANPRLDSWLVRDLNEDPRLPFGDAEFDAAGICVSVDYLIRPVEVLRECGRVVGRGGPLVITFSNRCFPTKVIAAWQMLDDAGHLDLVARYLEEAGTWTDIERLDRTPRRTMRGAEPVTGEAGPGDMWQTGWGGDPLYAVIGRSASGD